MALQVKVPQHSEEERQPEPLFLQEPSLQVPDESQVKVSQQSVDEPQRSPWPVQLTTTLGGAGGGPEAGPMSQARAPAIGRSSHSLETRARAAIGAFPA